MMYFDETTRDEKIMVLLSLSLFNTGLSLILFSFLFQKELHLLLDISSYSSIEITNLFLITGLVNFILTVYVYPKVYEYIQPQLESYFTKINGSTQFEKPMLKRYFDNNNFDTIVITIFDFENKFIHQGELVGTDDYHVNKLGVIHIENEKLEALQNYEDSLSYYKKTDNNKVRLILDYENKVKIFITYFNSKKKTESK